MSEDFRPNDDVFAVAGWRVRTAKDMGCILVRLPFIRGPKDDPDLASTDRVYALLANQADQLSEALARAAHSLRSSAPKT